MRGDTVFRHLVHFRGAYLNFEKLPEIGYDRSVERLVHIALGRCNIIFYTTGHRLPLLVDNAEHLVTLLYLSDYYAHGGQVVNLVERKSLVFHFAVNGIKMLGSAHHVAVHAVFP